MRFFKLIFLVLSLVSIHARGDVIITGKIMNAKAGKVLLKQNSAFLTDFLPDVIFSSEVVTDSLSITLPLKRAKLITFYFSGTGINQEIFVSPGDKIQFILNDKGVAFFGRNQGSYNFSAEMACTIDNRTRPSFKKYADLLDYKADLLEWFNKKRAFLNRYSKAHNLSKQAIKFFNENIQYEYNFYLNSAIADVNANKKNVPRDYLDDTTKFNKGHLLLGNSFYSDAVIRKFLYTEVDNPYDHCNEVYTNAVRKLKGKTRDYFMTNMIGLFIERAAKGNKDNLVRIINAEKEIIKDTTYLNYIRKKEAKLLILDKKLPDLVLDKTFLTSYDGRRLSLRELLEINRGKALYIDFWASWCIPCREDIKNSAIAKELTREKGVEYLYFSVDKNDELWKKAVQEESIEKNQYLTIEGLKSPLAVFLQTFYIPRYIFLDEHHVVKNIYAPRPTEINDLKKLISPPVVTTY